MTDGNGNFYIADTLNNRVRMVNPAGIVTTAAGNGAAGFSGDGGPATSASLNQPTGVAVDTGGNLYIADEYDNRIRKVAPGGIITTVAGNGNAGFSGDGGPATSAQLYFPTGVAVDGTGQLYIADYMNQRIRKVNSVGTIGTLAGNGNEGYSCGNGAAAAVALNHPFGVALDYAGNLYIADEYNQCIRKVTPGGGIATVAGNGLATFGGDGGSAASASLNYPTGVAVDQAGNLFIADYVNNRVRWVNASGVISTFAGNGTAGFSGDGAAAGSAELYQPTGVAASSPPVTVAGP